ncbi:MAG: rhomboid family intramembrane serine protease [Flavobacteriales bacterium]|nr:rhomboid family intramembrane serine protease [Flavobacteriales bacterium]
MAVNLTLFIIIITVAVSLLSLNNREYFYRFQYNPYVVKHNKQWYRIFSHALIHGDYMHLFFNMYVLYNFGTIAEEYYIGIFGAKGILLYGVLYVGGVMFAALPAYKKHSENSYYNSVGASGAVSAVLFASILFMPTAGLHIMFIPISIPAFVFGGLYLILEAYMDKKSNDNIAHDAHIWGALFGIVFTIILKPAIALYFIESVNDYLNSFF